MAAKKVKTSKNLGSFSKKQLLIFAAVFAVVGGFFVWHSFALVSPGLSPVLSVEAEAMNLIGSYTVTSDSTASGGKYVIFPFGSKSAATASVSLPSSSDNLVFKVHNSGYSSSCGAAAIVPYVDNQRLKTIYPSSSNWEYVTVKLSTPLEMGAHTLNFATTFYVASGSTCKGNNNVFIDNTVFSSSRCQIGQSCIDR